jgi:YjbE family integral membrane protein
VNIPGAASLVAVGEIIWVNILLSGDNAVVIALACRGLPDRRRWLGMSAGALVAILLRVVFTGIVAQLLAMPLLRIVGGAALVWIAIRLIVSDSEAGGDAVAASNHLFGAIRVIAIADLVMSLDNVIAISAIAEHDPWLLIVGLLISIPIIVAGSGFIMLAIGRFPLLVWAGGGLLGWIAGRMIPEDPWLHLGEAPAAAFWCGLAGALLVLGVAALLRCRSKETAPCPTGNGGPADPPLGARRKGATDGSPCNPAQDRIRRRDGGIDDA